MDIVALIKLLSLVLYPLGLVFSLGLFGLVMRLMNKRKAAAISWVFSALLLWVFVTPQFAVKLTAWLESQYPPLAVEAVAKHDVIVVMGGGLRLPSKPVERLQFTHATDRYWLAYQLFEQGAATTIVILGGNVYAQPGIEAESYYARELLVEWGVPPEAIIIDESSRTTEQNVRQFLALRSTEARLARQDLSVALVTSAMHMPRSYYLMRHHLPEQVEITPISADVLIREEQLPWFRYWMPDAGALVLLTRTVHELYGTWFVKLKYRFS